MSPAFPAERIQLSDVAPKQTAAMFRFMRSIELDERLRTLVSTRASQINGCAFCLDMHWKDALAAGESKERLYSLNAWRESPLYEEQETARTRRCRRRWRSPGSSAASGAPRSRPRRSRRSSTASASRCSSPRAPSLRPAVFVFVPAPRKVARPRGEELPRPRLAESLDRS